MKTIEAIVTDGTGATGSALIEVYAVRRIEASGEVLERGKTYLVLGTLFTIPDEYDMRTGDISEPEGGPSELWVSIDQAPTRAFVKLNIETGEELHRCVKMSGPSGPFCAEPSSSPLARSLDALLEEFSISRGRAPAVDRP